MEHLLLPGDWVEVRSAPEILATLDEHHALDGLPFMPEMLPACGRRFRVAMRAERACVHPPQVPLRRLAGTVVLERQRCDGAAHGGCQLGCATLWKERWLRRVDGPGEAVAARAAAPARSTPVALRVRRADDPARWTCQATELPGATSPGDPLWRPGQWVHFLRVKTFTPAELLGMWARIGLRRAGRALRGAPGAAPRGAPAPGPHALEPGEWVEVKGLGEIERTLDARRMHRGLPFSGEMAVFCGRRLRVARRVDRILDERTGRLRDVRDTVVLEGVACDRYLGCARAMPLLWREAWLRRAAGEA
ncbi:MAG TPA: hypothetical protein VD838_06335 [Anaeromyxobacteraceae bacterium]|nr:hypothetical protein [Anaeromyxobacteraceae bacterium]